MRHLVYFLFSSFLLLGCGTGKRGQELQQKEAELAQKEKELFAREEALTLRETALAQRFQALDSATYTDTVNFSPASVTGKWTAQMTCTETTCPGSAVGDVKTEQWEITNQGSTIVVRAMANGQLARVYTGSSTNGTIELAEELASAAAPDLAKMLVRLKPVSTTRMEGQREIIRENNCRVLYSLQLDAATK